MIDMKTKVNIDDFLHLILWIKTFYVIEGKKFNHDGLIAQAETYKLKNTPFDTNIHHIDNLMIDAYQVYHRLKITEEKVNQMMDMIQIPFININKDMMISETNKYKKIFEDLLENYKYDDPEIRGIQKGFLGERMKEYVEVEDYENAARLRDMIKLC